MKKSIVALVFFLSMTGTSYADCSLGDALEFCYGPYTVDTKILTKGSGITGWRHGILPEPNQIEINQCIVDCTLDTVRTGKVQAVIDYALSLVPEFKDYGTFKAFSEFYQSVDNKTPTAWVSNVIAVRAAAINAIAIINGYTTLADIEAYDEVNTPGWP